MSYGSGMVNLPATIVKHFVSIPITHHLSWPDDLEHLPWPDSISLEAVPLLQLRNRDAKVLGNPA